MWELRKAPKVTLKGKIRKEAISKDLVQNYMANLGRTKEVAGVENTGNLFLLIMKEALLNWNPYVKRLDSSALKSSLPIISFELWLRRLKAWLSIYRSPTFHTFELRRRVLAITILALHAFQDCLKRLNGVILIYGKYDFSLKCTWR